MPAPRPPARSRQGRASMRSREAWPRSGRSRAACRRLAGPRGASLIDDSYNANPDSVRAAIDVLAGEPGTRFLLLGDMGEVGERGTEFHEEIGRYARERGIDRLLATGDLCRAAVAAFGKGARHFAAVEGLIA